MSDLLCCLALGADAQRCGLALVKYAAQFNIALAQFVQIATRKNLTAVVFTIHEKKPKRQHFKRGTIEQHNAKLSGRL